MHIICEHSICLMEYVFCNINLVSSINFGVLNNSNSMLESVLLLSIDLHWHVSPFIMYVNGIVSNIF